MIHSSSAKFEGTTPSLISSSVQKISRSLYGGVVNYGTYFAVPGATLTAYYHVPYSFNLQIKSKPNLNKNDIGILATGTNIIVYREDPNEWVEFSFEANGEKYWTLKVNYVCD
ncbi:hypothetical protein IIQ_00023 [Bacillus cereus VD118]|uniref:Uncharacterized protein n=1 Tax=Bacillus cereus VD118 TaxID=1053231 RepID=R8QM78_BACCE|nr:hypothetical protein IIQ_00023 [Bacillus cereus VD118]MBJ8095561.1 endo-beta-N-acetylglucosaminidase [Bacillus cereus]CAH2464490.1 hypothetical protein ACOSJ1_EBGNOMHC_05024 [Bacillus mycoides KBAB4]